MKGGRVGALVAANHQKRREHRQGRVAPRVHHEQGLRVPPVPDPLFPEYSSCEEALRYEHIDDLPERVKLQVRNHSYAVLRRTTQYREGSPSYITEAFVLIRRPISCTAFRGELSGNITYVGSGDRSDVIYSTRGREGTKYEECALYPLLDPQKAWELRLGEERYRCYRYLVEFHIEKFTESKRCLHEHFKGNIHLLFPRFFVAYVKIWVQHIKERSESGVLVSFIEHVQAYKKHQEREKHERLNQARRVSAYDEVPAPSDALRGTPSPVHNPAPPPDLESSPGDMIDWSKAANIHSSRADPPSHPSAPSVPLR
eukprot:Sspe_Gene.40574::Locus_19602_Transcript_2_2_Confidence_0.400_Length_983::g.40574::m.40574